MDLDLDLNVARLQNWDSAPAALCNLRSRFLNFSNIDRNLIQSMSPREFCNAYFSPSRLAIRAHTLMNILKSVYSDNSFWNHVVTAEAILKKCRFACERWGIEKNKRIIEGYCNMEDSYEFWTNIFDSANLLSSNTPRAKRLLEVDLPQNEEEISWEEIIAKGLKDVQSGDNVFNINMNEVMKLEQLHRNGMTTTACMQKLKTSVGKALVNLEEAQDRSFLDDESKSISSSETQEKGDLILRLANKYIDFMEANEDFIHKKTEFLLFHTGIAMKLMNEALDLHRQFLLETTEDDLSEPEWT